GSLSQTSSSVSNAADPTMHFSIPSGSVSTYPLLTRISGNDTATPDDFRSPQAASTPACASSAVLPSLLEDVIGNRSAVQTWHGRRRSIDSHDRNTFNELPALDALFASWHEFAIARRI